MTEMRSLLLKKISAVLLISTFAAACGESIPHETDMPPIQFKFHHKNSQSKPLRMDIPFAYLRKPWKLIAKKKTQPISILRGKEIQIKTVFPELTPHPQSFGKTGKYKQGLFIFVYGNDSSDSEKSYERNLKLYKENYQLKSTEFFGFHQYETPCSESRCTGEDFDYLISRPESIGKKIIYGRCYKLERNSGGGCRFKTSYMGKGVRYVFRRSQLHKWREIDAHVRQLLDSFLVEEHDR